MSERYTVEYVGRFDPHTLTFEGPLARVRAIRYARERGRTSAARVLDSAGAEVWRIEEPANVRPSKRKRGTDGSRNHPTPAD